MMLTMKSVKAHLCSFCSQTALKTLMVVHRLMQECDVYFLEEVFSLMPLMCICSVNRQRLL